MKIVTTKAPAGNTTNRLEYVKLTDPKLFLRWYLDKYQFIKVDLIQVRV